MTFLASEVLALFMKALDENRIEEQARIGRQ
jgi:hypothetical protein